MANVFENRIVGYTTKRASELAANPQNWRKHPEKQRAAVQASLRELGWIAAVVENVRSGYLVDGHERVWQALKNDEVVPVLQVDLSEAEERLALATFDPITYMAETDAAALDALLRDVETGEAALQELIAGLAADAGLYQDKTAVDAEPQIDRAEELRVKWGVQSGDLWQLGDHRLICGDCTDAAVVARVMGGEKAQLLLTDPPYGVDYGELVRSRTNQKKDGWRDIANDALSNDELSALLEKSLGGCGATVGFVWHPAGARRWLFWKAAEANGWRIAQEIVWVKNALVFGRADYQWRHEPCLYLKRDGAPKQEDRTQTTVWEVNKPVDSQHPTQKPVELFAIPVKNHTQAMDIVYEPFSGSGTTIIACEQLGRKCRAAEISPGYVAVALQRYFDATGREPVRVE